MSKEILKGGLADNKTIEDIAKNHKIDVGLLKVQLKNGVEVGEYYYWVDSDMEIPKRYKNNENIVVDPKTGEKLYEYFLSGSTNMYHDLDTEMLYREYKYDYGLDRFIRLSAVSMPDAFSN